jgi:hypothetical protein
MTDQKFSQQPNAASLTGTERVPLVQAGGNVTAALSAIAANVLASNANVDAFANLVGANDRIAMFTGTGSLTLVPLTALARDLIASADATAQKAALPWILASPAFTGTPTVPTAAVGTSTTQAASTAMVQAEIANKRAWTSYTPTLTAGSNSYTSASATGKYMVAFGVCHFAITITITTKGTGAYPIVTLPFAPLAGMTGMPVGTIRVVAGIGGFAAINASTIVCADMSNGDIGTVNGAVLNVYGSYPIA